MAALADVTNSTPQVFGSAASSAKKPRLLACIANGNLRSRVPSNNDNSSGTDDVTMLDINLDSSCSMSVAPTGHDGIDDATMASCGANQEAAVRMRSTRLASGVGGEEDSSQLSFDSIGSIL